MLSPPYTQTLTQSDKIDEAIKIAKAIDDSSYKSDALSSITQTLTQSDKIDEAIKIAKAIDDSSYKSDALSSIRSNSDSI